MTEYRNLKRAIVIFDTREGTPTAMEVDLSADPKAFAYLAVHGNGELVNFQVEALNLANAEAYKFVGLDDEDYVLTPRALVATGSSKNELGTVGKWMVGVVAVSFLVPILGILWACGAWLVNHILGGMI